MKAHHKARDEGFTVGYQGGENKNPYGFSYPNKSWDAGYEEGKAALEYEKHVAEHRAYEAEKDAPWIAAKDAINDTGVFSDEQIALLSDMIDAMREAVD